MHTDKGSCSGSRSELLPTKVCEARSPSSPDPTATEPSSGDITECQGRGSPGWGLRPQRSCFPQQRETCFAFKGKLGEECAFVSFPSLGQLGGDDEATLLTVCAQEDEDRR